MRLMHAHDFTHRGIISGTLCAMQTQRHIRSFVLRAGRMTPAQERALTELWPLLRRGP